MKVSETEKRLISRYRLNDEELRTVTWSTDSKYLAVGSEFHRYRTYEIS